MVIPSFPETSVLIACRYINIFITHLRPGSFECPGSEIGLVTGVDE